MARRGCIRDSGTNPAWVELSTNLLKGAAGAYLFTSSTGVYYPYLRRGLSETDPVHTDLQNPNDGSETFGVAKARCESQVMQIIDVRDLAAFMVHLLESGQRGIYNAAIRNDRAFAAGLGFRPLTETLRDTLAWWPTVPQARRDRPRFTITPEIEAKALADWRQRANG